MILVNHGKRKINKMNWKFWKKKEELVQYKIIILPNNKNIVLAANQAAELTVKEVAVVPSVSIPQGVAAMLALDPDGDHAEMVRAMSDTLADIQSAELTVATRSVEIDGVNCSEGQVIGLLNGKLAVSGDDLGDCLIKTLEMFHPENAELITLYYGADLSTINANQLADRVRERWPNQELELVDGGQPHYQIILSVE